MKDQLNRMEKFISAQKIMTLATSKDNVPYCCSVFYVFDPENYRFHFKSSIDTVHISHIRQNPMVAGTIVRDTQSILSLKGLQMTGRIVQTDEEDALKLYHRRFPFAKILNAHIWTIDAHELKFTDNTLGFGKKFRWSREAQD